MAKNIFSLSEQLRRSAMLSFQSNHKHDRQQYQNAICKRLLDSCYKPLRSEFDVGMANYKKNKLFNS